MSSPGSAKRRGVSHGLGSDIRPHATGTARARACLSLLSFKLRKLWLLPLPVLADGARKVTHKILLFSDREQTAFATSLRSHRHPTVVAHRPAAARAAKVPRGGPLFFLSWPCGCAGAEPPMVNQMAMCAIWPQCAMPITMPNALRADGNLSNEAMASNGQFATGKYRSKTKRPDAAPAWRHVDGARRQRP